MQPPVAERNIWRDKAYKLARRALNDRHQQMAVHIRFAKHRMDAVEVLKWELVVSRLHHAWRFYCGLATSPRPGTTSAARLSHYRALRDKQRERRAKEER